MNKQKLQAFIIAGHLPSRNEAEAAARSHWSKGNQFKREYTDMVYWCIKSVRLKPVAGKATITITFYEKNKRRDADNIIGGGLKYILDGIVKAEIIKDDSPKYLDLVVNPIKHDKLNPRIEIIISGEYV